MTGVVMDAGQPLDHPRHPWQSPQVGVKTMGSRSLAERSVELPEVPRFQFRLSTGAASAPQSCHATTPPVAIPTSHALATDLQLPSDVREDHLTGGEQAGGLFAPQLQSVEVPPRRHRHSCSIDENGKIVTTIYEIVTILCEIQ